MKPRFRTNNLVGTADLEKLFSEFDATNWSYKVYNVDEINNGTIQTYKIDNLSVRYHEAIVKKTNLTIKEKNSVMKKVNIIYFKMSLTITAYTH